ncbi:hypothetical protein [Komagataeibacter oboediens]|uniref:Uncharacterized protein n=1 Tax=Komagataeibacter oboediens TaxID=65958 RepID=A0ABS5SRI2_9PROT|nr:hypothetical protein [Komagataeibacter oboediens]MBL7234169.1 hypothetical protein [Komagataeibacter oboediens]MBT0676829.1 hypothetical protein [Komagataeibacter oboediens]MBT0680125.1 hypothetical protein [Komagataeibacter oboediens]
MTTSFTRAAKIYSVQREICQLVTTGADFSLDQAILGETEFDFKGADT